MQWLNVVMGEGRPFSAVQQVGQNVLHQKAPHKWDVTNVLLHTVAKGDNVAKVQLVPQLLKGPLVFGIFGQAFLQEEPSHAQTGSVPQDVSNKAGPGRQLGNWCCRDQTKIHSPRRNEQDKY
jgi:hypothetical protein